MRHDSGANISPSLIERVKRRKIFQWTLAYVTAAWLLVQVIEVLEGPWNIPVVWVRLSHVIMAAGLPIAAIVAWHHGERGRQRISGFELLAIASVLFAAGLGVTFFGPLDQPDNQVPEAAEQTGRAGNSGIPRLAVLAFSNLGAPADAFFAHGMTAELNSRLSGLQHLAVISRSSAEMFRGSNKPALQIGKELGADYVLTGTVQWARGDDGTAIRVNPELIRVADDTQVWAGQIERGFEQALSIQSEIAGQVVTELDLSMSIAEDEVLQQRPTRNPLAYEAYLKGIQLAPDGHAPEAAFQQARTFFLQAVNLDPSFALAWSRLADTDMGIYWFGYDATEARLALALEAIDTALQLNPELPEARIALGEYYYRLRDFDRALGEFAEIFEERPNDSRIVGRLGYIWRRQGLFEQALETLEKAMVQDPLRAYTRLEVAWTNLFLDHFDRALMLIDEAEAIDPSEEWTYLIRTLALWCRAETGDLQRARQALEAYPDPRSTYPIYLWTLQHVFEGDPAGALERLRNAPVAALVMQSNYLPVELLAGRLLSLMERPEEARPLLEQARSRLIEEIARNPADFRMHLALAKAYAQLGKPDDAVTTAEAGVELMPLENDALMGADALYDLIEVYALVGQDELALDTMARLLSVPSPYAGFWFTRNPAFERLRANPRFSSILHPQTRRRTAAP